MNKDNAHLYLPLVQALIDGKLQRNDGTAIYPEWNDARSLSEAVGIDNYRVKPLDFAPIPDGAVRHNPDGLTPEQVGEGHRLCCDDEFCDIPNEFFNASKGEWITGGQFGTEKFWNQSYTYRTPLSTPYPCGSVVKDGKLVKPWTPRFKVGDRVFAPGGQKPCVIERIDADECWYWLKDIIVPPFKEDELQPYVWTLTRHLPGFRPLRDGEEWHREDWTEEMLPEGWRPLLKGEQEVPNEDEFYDSGKGPWVITSSKMRASSALFPIRTRRPLPEPPRFIPWTFETRPLEVVWVYKKGFISDRQITAWKDDSVEIGQYAAPTYEVLLSDWLQRDGSPCGTEVES